MKIYRFILTFFFILAMYACSNEEYLQFQNGMEVDITFKPTIDCTINSRTIGDASNIDQLIIGVYEGTETLSKAISFSEDWDIVQRNGITLSLVEGRTYKIVFGAQDANNTAYTLTDDGNISVDYTDYINGGFTKMEELDAFYGISVITVGASKNEQKEITLSRPFAQLNFADNTPHLKQGVHQAIIKYYNIPTAFNPFEGTVTTASLNNENDDVTFIFTDFPKNESLKVDGISYNYVSTNYLFTPDTGITTIEGTIELQQIDGTSVNTFEFKSERAITLERNKKTNVIGTMVLQPEIWSVWNGIFPTECTLTTDPDIQDRYIIDEADDLAWLSVKENALSLDENHTFVMTIDIDMNQKTGLLPIQLPTGSTLNGNGHTIKGLKLNDALLGDVVDITIKDLIIEETTVTNTNNDVTHVGILVNNLKGSNTFSKIQIKNSSASTQNGAAGGIVGYISRKEPNNREETLVVIFDDCHISETTINGTLSEGHFVGLLRGYDNGEILQFNSNCTLTLSPTATQSDELTSLYREGNEGAWLASNDYSKYNDWLGDEECYRAIIMYGNNRFIPCWDGIKKIEPITHKKTINNKEIDVKLIYSAFDLASLQGKDHTAVYFKENIDLGGNRTTNKNKFTPIRTIGTLDGEDYKLYNLNIFHKNGDVGFINGTSGDNTVHKNLHFVNSSVRADMTGNETNVYVGTLCPKVNTKYLVENITITNGYVLGLGKLGGMIGFVTTESSASLEINNCKVIDTTIENIESSAIERFGNKYVYADFSPQGEAGGLIGFIGNETKITNCHVTNCNINCYGQDMKYASIFKVPGRHVNRFIGDIRTVNGDIVIINKCTADNNSFNKRKEDFQYEDCKLVGRCYYIQIGIKIPYIGEIGIYDTIGKLIVDGTDYMPFQNNGNLNI